jgi:hypothetical protein
VSGQLKASETSLHAFIEMSSLYPSVTHYVEWVSVRKMFNILAQSEILDHATEWLLYHKKAELALRDKPRGNSLQVFLPCHKVRTTGISGMALTLKRAQPRNWCKHQDPSESLTMVRYCEDPHTQGLHQLPIPPSKTGIVTSIVQMESAEGSRLMIPWLIWCDVRIKIPPV